MLNEHMKQMSSLKTRTVRLITLMMLAAWLLCVAFSYGQEPEKSGQPQNDYSRAIPGSAYSLKDYARWIDFDKGRWFTIFHLALPLPPWGDVIDRMANCAFRYLVSGNPADRDYFIEKQLELAGQDCKTIFLGNSFEGGNTAHPHGDRIAQELAEVYLAMRHTMTPVQRKKVEKWYHEFAWHTWKNSPYAERQGTKGGFMAVVGFMTGDTAMTSKAREFLSFEDTWTIQEDSRHYAGLIMERMFRIELFTNQRQFPESSKANLAKQMRWILKIFPHNGFNPVWGACWIPNEVDHYMECLIMASCFLKDYDRQLASECRWLAERMFEYGKRLFSDRIENSKIPEPSGFSVYNTPDQPGYVPKIQVNPIHLYWYLNESLVPRKPDIHSFGSQVVYRSRALKDIMDRDICLGDFEYMMDKIVHRDSWNEDALFVMLDPVIAAAKNIGPGAGNAIISISCGSEEFITNKILNRYNLLYIQHSVSDVPSDSRGNYNCHLQCFTDNPDFSRSVTSLDGWIRSVTLYKTGDRRIEVTDSLPAGGNVYWHLQGVPEMGKDQIILNIRNTTLEVSYTGHENSWLQDNDTWNDPNPLFRWGYAGNPDRQLKLYRSTSGKIITVFRPLKRH
jgi:hypothetical protein